MNEAQKVFRNYIDAQTRMRHCRRMRNGLHRGIAAADDYHARLWRKYEALSKRQEAYLMMKLGEVE